MSYKKDAYRLKSESVIKNFKKRNIKGYYCDNKEEALNKVLELIDEKSSVSWGGSMTIKEIGLTEALKNGNFKVVDRDTAKTMEERQELLREAFFMDNYVISSNAVTLDGELVNIDGTGNRVAAISFGPKNVIFIVGINKVVSDLDCAVKRVQNQAAPPNVQRLNLDTSCSKTGYCMDCFTDDCICGQILVTRFAKPKDRIKVVIVGEELGY